MTQKPEIHILLGVTGSVATIKANQVAISLRNAFKDYTVTIKIITTDRSRHFLPDDINNSVDELLRDEDEWQWQKRGDPVLHIELVKWADIFLIAPLDALTTSKIANG